MKKRLHIVENVSISITSDKKTKTNKLENLLCNVVDKTLKQIFKEEGTEYIFIFIRTHSSLKREEIADKPEAFSTSLKKLLSSGAPVIEKLILKNLYRKFELEFVEKKGREFSDYIKELRNELNRRHDVY